MSLLLMMKKHVNLSGEYSLVNAAKKIHEMGPKYVVIKKGEHGALLFNEGKHVLCTGFAISRSF